MKKQLDEMERNIRLQSQSLGFKVSLLLLAIWTLYEEIAAFVVKQPANTIPGTILVASCLIEAIYAQSIKHRMVDGDEEYREPNKALWIIVMGVVIAAILVSAGSLLLRFS